MDQERARQAIYDIRDIEGTDKIEKFLRGEAVDNLPNDRLKRAIDTLGEDRVRQLLGLDGELWITVWSKADENTESERDQILERLETLWFDGKIADYSTITIPKQVNTDGSHGDSQYTEAFKQFQIWASRNGLTLNPFFQRDSSTITFPKVFLVVRSQHHRKYLLTTSDRETAALNGVFPCSDEHTQYNIDNYLSAVESETDWRQTNAQTGLTTPDFGAHGAIKSHLISNSTDTVGSDWRIIADEHSTGNLAEEDVGRIDLIFEHRSDDKYLLVEVKPGRDEVDTAFGQIGRYKYQYLSDQNRPSITPENVKLAIAAPEFYDSHKKLAQDWNIELVQVPRDDI